MHKFKYMESDMLACSVWSAFIAFDPQSIQKVWDCWKLVLDLIIHRTGANNLIEIHCGKLTSSLNYLLAIIDVCDMSVLLDGARVDNAEEVMTNDRNATAM